MKQLFLFALIGIGLLACQSPQPKDTPTEATETKVGLTEQEISFTVNGPLNIYGNLYHADKAQPIILLFHQARSNARGEYGSIIPRLTDAGFNVLAIDQRVGGDTHGSENRTMANIENNEYGYCDAYPEVEGALQYVIDQGFTGKKIVWGSSYSAALVLQLAAKNPTKVDGVLAFSPASGEPLKDCMPNPFLERIKQPTLLLRPASEMERESSINQFEMAEQAGHQIYVSDNGIHGSSMLVRDRIEGDPGMTWEVVERFLSSIK